MSGDKPPRYLVTSNGQIHDASDNENVAEYSARELSERTGQEVSVYTCTFTIGVRDER